MRSAIRTETAPGFSAYRRTGFRSRRAGVTRTGVAKLHYQRNKLFEKKQPFCVTPTVLEVFRLLNVLQIFRPIGTLEEEASFSHEISKDYQLQAIQSVVDVFVRRTLRGRSTVEENP